MIEKKVLLSTKVKNELKKTAGTFTPSSVCVVQRDRRGWQWLMNIKHCLTELLAVIKLCAVSPSLPLTSTNKDLRYEGSE